MKKTVLTIVALLSMTVAMAENESAASVASVESFDMREVNINRLANALELSSDQFEVVSDVHSQFCKELLRAGRAHKDDRQELVDRAVRKDIANMHYILDKKQYKKYLMLLNATLNNRGLK